MNRSYGYDGSGNPTGDGSRTFVYNGSGRLVKLYKSGVLSAEYTYDGRGRRAAKKAYTKAVALDPESEIGKAADASLQAL